LGKDNYIFKDLILDLLTGREIEFNFKKSEYSITNYIDENGEAYWQFDNNTKRKNIIICKKSQNAILINFVENFSIEDMDLKDIFNNKIYTNLYVL